MNQVARLADRIRLGEDTTLELKDVVVEGSRITSPDRGDFASELVALANTQGGTVVLGVDDSTRAVRGIPLQGLDAVERWAGEICNDSIDPPMDVRIYKLELKRPDGAPAPIVQIEIPQSLFVHRSPRGYFERIGR